MSHSPVTFLFPGQGSQAAGMGKELAALYPVARHTFQEADDALGFAISQLCFEGPDDQLKLTENTQPAIVTMSTAVARVLQEKGIVPQFAAGHSLGEYSAHVAAGTLSFAEAVRTVRDRGRYMQQAVPAGEGGMAAILGMPLDQLQQVCADAAQGEIVSPANINSPDQIAISGHQKAVERAAELAKERGATKAIMLVVSAPFHCALMQPAQDRLEKDMQALHFKNPEFPIIANIDATAKTTGEESRQALVRQVTGAVQWAKCMQTLIGQGVKTFVEVGPGKVLTGLMRQIDRSQTCLNAEDEASVQKVSNLFAAAAKE
ncbi:MAG TPA: ACP S-malonyltransferase [Candidatus Angelobacter sp.]|jgi:[acyl-carrier-protein] S-malonyltransferase|nr:ACP S-malonyltransferase [Candidatus Angelobacter sp.]